jgi:hypothetical protein
MVSFLGPKSLGLRCMGLVFSRNQIVSTRPVYFAVVSAEASYGTGGMKRRPNTQGLQRGALRVVFDTLYTDLRMETWVVL